MLYVYSSNTPLLYTQYRGYIQAYLVMLPLSLCYANIYANTPLPLYSLGCTLFTCLSVIVPQRCTRTLYDTICVRYSVPYCLSCTPLLDLRLAAGRQFGILVYVAKITSFTLSRVLE